MDDQNIMRGTVTLHSSENCSYVYVKYQAMLLNDSIVL